MQPPMEDILASMMVDFTQPRQFAFEELCAIVLQKQPKNETCFEKFKKKKCLGVLDTKCIVY